MLLILKKWRNHEENLRLGTVRGQMKVSLQLHWNLMDWHNHEKKLGLGITWKGQSSWRNTSQGVEQLWQRPQHFEDAITIRWPLRTALGMEQSQPELSSQVPCAVNSRAREMKLPRSFSSQNTSPGNLILSFILLDGFYLDLILCHDSSFLK